MTEDGIPCMYYGTEQNFDGGNDPANREVFWTANFDETNATFQHFSELAKIRKTYPALRRGDLSVVYSTSHIAQEDDAGIFAYERKGGDPANAAYALIVLNTNDFKSSTTADTNAMMTTAPPNTVLVDVLDPQQTQYTVAADGTLRMQVPAQSASILIPQNQVQNL